MNNNDNSRACSSEKNYGTYTKSSSKKAQTFITDDEDQNDFSSLGDPPSSDTAVNQILISLGNISSTESRSSSYVTANHSFSSPKSSSDNYASVNSSFASDPSWNISSAASNASEFFPGKY